MTDVETEREMSRAEVAAYLHEFADRFGGQGATDGTNREHSEMAGDETGNTDADDAEAFVDGETDDTDDKRADGTTRNDSGRVTFTVGGDSATVNPPDTVQFRVAVDSTSGMLESGDHETVEFTLDWDSEPVEGDELDIR